jgi:putative transposase
LSKSSFDVALFSVAPKGHRQNSPGQRPAEDAEIERASSPERAAQPEGPAMSQSLVKNLVHLAHGTKGREGSIPINHRDRLFAYQAGIFKDWDSPALKIGGVEDHVHALFVLSKNHALGKIVEEVKKGSSKWMKIDGPKNAAFHWQAGYAAFSVSPSNVAVVTRYIENQDKHHRKMPFQDELRALLHRHAIEFDERYVWV